MGLGVGFIFTPATALVGVHFKRRRSFALGTAMSGMGFGALAFPIRASDSCLFQLYSVVNLNAFSYICLTSGQVRSPLSWSRIDLNDFLIRLSVSSFPKLGLVILWEYRDTLLSVVWLQVTCWYECRRGSRRKPNPLMSHRSSVILSICGIYHREYRQSTPGLRVSWHWNRSFLGLLSIYFPSLPLFFYFETCPSLFLSLLPATLCCNTQHW